MSDVKWIQITTDVFDNWKIKKLKATPELGHTLVCIWFELLCMAGSCNASGLVVMSNRFVATDEIIATTFNEDVRIVKMALDLFSQLGMISVTEENAIQISNWEEYQNEAGLAKIRDYERERKAKYREQSALKIEDKSCPGNVPDKSVDSSISIYISNKDIINNIVTYLNNKSNKKYRSNTPKTVSLINARLKEGFTEEDFYKVIDNKCAAWLHDPKMNQYLCPETLFRPSNFEKYLNETKKEDIFGEFDLDAIYGKIYDAYPLKTAFDSGKAAFVDYVKVLKNPLDASRILYKAMNLYVKDMKEKYPNEPTKYLVSLDKFIREHSGGYIRQLGKE